MNRLLKQIVASSVVSLSLTLGMFVAPAAALAACDTPSATCSCSYTDEGTPMCVEVKSAATAQQGNTNATPSTQNQPAGPNSVTNGTFVPLTQIPAFQEAADGADLGKFFNTLYKLCIGAAAVLAVLQIMRAGIMYMSPDSIAEKGEARSLIGLAIFGLLLVLSPVIVFGIIDQRILNLGFSLAPLNNAPDSASNTPTPSTGGSQQGAAGTNLADPHTGTSPTQGAYAGDDAVAACAATGGSLNFDGDCVDTNDDATLTSQHPEVEMKDVPWTSSSGEVVWAGYIQLSDGYHWWVYQYSSAQGVSLRDLTLFCQQDVKHGSRYAATSIGVKECFTAGSSSGTFKVPASASLLSLNPSETNVTASMAAAARAKAEAD